jgi:hypothetical protein
MLGGKKESFHFHLYWCRARITGTPHGCKEFGVDENRASGLRTSKRNEHYLTAEPSHRFDGDMSILHQYDTAAFLHLHVPWIMIWKLRVWRDGNLAALVVSKRWRWMNLLIWMFACEYHVQLNSEKIVCSSNRFALSVWIGRRDKEPILVDMRCLLVPSNYSSLGWIWRKKIIRHGDPVSQDPKFSSIRGL